MVYFVKPICFVQILILILMMQDVLAHPGIFEEYNLNGRDMCRENDNRVVEVCQRCAKQTKSDIVYPMCCRNDEDVFQWCARFITYGMKPSPAS